MSRHSEFWPMDASPVASDCSVNDKGEVKVNFPVPFIDVREPEAMATAAVPAPLMVAPVAPVLIVKLSLIVRVAPVAIESTPCFTDPNVTELTVLLVLNEG